MAFRLGILNSIIYNRAMKAPRALNKPLTLSGLLGKYETVSRPLKDEEILLQKQEISLLEKNTKITWRSLRTYTPSLLLALALLLVTKKVEVFIGAFIASFTILKIVPSVIKGDSALLKKDISGGVVIIKSGPVTVVEDTLQNTYMKRLYIDGVIIDGIYSRGDILKYPDLTDGQNIEVVYSPNANYIFSVTRL